MQIWFNKCFRCTLESSCIGFKFASGVCNICMCGGNRSLNITAEQGEVYLIQQSDSTFLLSEQYQSVIHSHLVWHIVTEIHCVVSTIKLFRILSTSERMLQESSVFA